MTSQRQIEANRQNAVKAAGPRTAAGKARSSRNALKHGLSSEDVVMEGEDPAEFIALRRQLRRAIRPANELEEMLMDQMVSAAWRLRRAGRYERLLMTQELEKYRVFWDGNRELRERDFPNALALAIAEFFARGTYPNLARYEGHLNRAVLGALRELHRLRQDGLGQAGPKGWAARTTLETERCRYNRQKELMSDADRESALATARMPDQQEAEGLRNEPNSAYCETNPFLDRGGRGPSNPSRGIDSPAAGQ